ncbi:MAG TPA: protein kinase [Blastocatellia bacterium]|nr:protein kinase [Blastocatellia bacterium]
MKPERWARIKPIFYEAAEQPADERSAFIRSRCGDDESLALEIESLLGAHDQAGSFIEGLPNESTTLTLDAQPPDTIIGRRIGAYEVIQEIGRGGMGAVYLASRADEQFHKLVAIKLIKTGFDHESIIRRFRNERQILASLDHPNIARLLDGGVATDGLPYFVMEYIEGQSIRDYCDSRRLNTLERLRLFRSVCSAVHYAHQNLIVHRDIKPSNILVTPDGTPKLLDFGIAKLLGPSANLGEMTLASARVMTPEYASPEQARGEPITTSSDVYSLGVLLYELLTGHRPYHIASTSPLEIIQAICEREPEKPSTAVGRTETTNTAEGETTVTPEAVSKARNSQPEKLRRQLEGDLDNIVLKAMRKEPQRRYASVEQFSEDIRRYLEGLPVIARKDTFSYRAGKFIRRNKLGVTAAAIILVLLASGVAGIARQTIVANRQRARAEKRFNEVRNLANSFMFKFHDSIQNLPGATEARQLVVNESLQYLNSLADEAADDSSLQAELATAYFRLGDIQAVSRAGNLGDSKGAQESHRKALALRQSVVAAMPNDPQALVALAASYRRVGHLAAREDDLQTAMDYHRKAIEICEALLESDSNYLPARRVLATADASLGQILAQKDPAAALEHYNKAIREHEACLMVDTNDSDLRRDLSLLYKNTGAQIHAKGDIDAALVMYHKALAMDEAALAANPNDTETRLALSFSYGSIGSALAGKGDLAGALENYRKALELRLSVASADPKNAFAINAVASAYHRIGGTLLWMQDRLGASSNFQKVLEVHQSAGLLEQASDCAKIADVYSSLASESGVAQRDRIANLRDAVYWYRKSLDLRSSNSGQLSEKEAKERERIRQEITRCQATIASSKSS